MFGLIVGFCEEIMKKEFKKEYLKHSFLIELDIQLLLALKRNYNSRVNLGMGGGQI